MLGIGPEIGDIALVIRSPFKSASCDEAKASILPWSIAVRASLAS